MNGTIGAIVAEGNLWEPDRRAVLADALLDAGRDLEAELVRSGAAVRISADGAFRHDYAWRLRLARALQAAGSAWAAQSVLGGHSPFIVGAVRQAVGRCRLGGPRRAALEGALAALRDYNAALPVRAVDGLTMQHRAEWAAMVEQEAATFA